MYFYILIGGECSITRNGKKLSGKLGTIEEGASFGKHALLFEKREHAATIEASKVSTKTGNIQLYRLDGALFYHKVTPRKLEILQLKMKDIMKVFDTLSGVDTKVEEGTIIPAYIPSGWWLSRQWTGTILQFNWMQSVGMVSRIHYWGICCVLLLANWEYASPLFYFIMYAKDDNHGTFGAPF